MFESVTKLCRACLSANRKLISISPGDLILYYTLLGEDQKLDAKSMCGVDLCWECEALLRRTRKFRAQVQKAHTILEDCLGLPPDKTTLSSLTLQHKLEYDAIFKETEQHDSPLSCNMKLRNITADKIVVPMKYKAHVTHKDVESATDLKEVSNDTEFKTENMSDGSDHYESDDASDTSDNSLEITVRNVTPLNEIQDTLVKPLNLGSVKFNKSNSKVAKSRCNTGAKKRKVGNKTTVSVAKTPALIKLELELQKLMQKNIQNLTSASKSSADSAANHRHKESQKYKGHVKDLDPDFNLNEDEDVASDDSRIEGDEEEPEEKLDDGDNKNRRRRRYKKIITYHKNIADILSCFTEIEMSVDEMKSVLEKEDAIVDEKKSHKCNICGQKYTLHRSLKYHASARHRGTYPECFRKGNFYNPPPAIPEKSLWRCSVCSSMVRKEHIVAHMNDLHRTQYFCNGDGCEWSQKVFWMKEEHAEHWAAIHQQFKCDHCSKRKQNKPMLEVHMMEKHSSLYRRSTKCPHCSRTFVLERALQRHVSRRHAAPAELRYCVECDVTFKTVAGLQTHFAHKHDAARKWYTCGECGRQLATEKSLQSHRDLKHVGSTQYCCHVCGKYFCKAHGLDKHLKAHSNQNVKLPKTKPCTICGRMFQNARVLRHHTYTHTGERPYACAHCGAAYTQPHCLRKHLMKRHGIEQGVREIGPNTSTAADD